MDEQRKSAQQFQDDAASEYQKAENTSNENTESDQPSNNTYGFGEYQSDEE